MEIEQKENGLRKKTDFKYDSENIGPIAEQHLINILMSGGKRVEDISSIPGFRAFDIDIIEYEDDKLVYRDLLKEYYAGKDGRDLALKTYECKTDTYGFKSRNIVYEDISNSNPGCMAKSKASYVFYVFVDKDGRILEEYLIDLHALRWWLNTNFHKINIETFKKKNSDGIIEDKKLIAPKSMRRGKDNTGIFLIDIDFLNQYSKIHSNEKYGEIVKSFKIYY